MKVLSKTIANVQSSDDSWTVEQPFASNRATKRVQRVKIDLFKNSGVLDAKNFDETYHEFKLPNSQWRNTQQVIAVKSKSLSYDKSDGPESAVTYHIHDVSDAAILLHSRETDVVLQSLEALIAFCEGPLDPVTEYSPSLPVSGQIPVISQNLKIDEEDGDPYFKATLVQEPGFLRRVLRLLKHPYECIQRRALILFGSLSNIEETILQAENLSWLPSVHHLIKTGTDDVVLDWLLIAVRNLSLLRNVQETMLRGDLLDRLLDLALLNDQDPDMVENTLVSLCNFCANHKIRSYLVLNGGFEVTSELALSEFPSTQYHALRLMRDLITAPVDGAIDRFYESDGMATILNILNSKELQFLHGNSLEVLGHLMGVPSIASILSHKRIYDFLLDMALSKDYREIETVQTFALQAISRAASFPEERLLMNSSDVEKKVLRLLTHKSYAIQEAALETIGVLAKTPNCCRRLRELGVVKRTAKFLRSRDPIVREWAFFAVGAMMTYDLAFQEMYIKEGFIDDLEGTIADSRYARYPGLLEHALSAVINLSDTEALKESLKRIVLGNIITLLTHPNEAVKSHALKISVIFVKDERTRDYFAKVKGYKAIGEILRMPFSDDLLKTVCWAITALCIKREVVLSVAAGGCVSTILEAKRSNNVVTSGYASLALQRLSSLYIPFKLALFDELGGFTWQMADAAAI